MPSAALPDSSNANRTVPTISTQYTASVNETPGPSTAILRSLSDPLPAPPIAEVREKKSVASLQTFDDPASRAVFKYPRFSTATTLAETGGPGFSMEELTSTDVSEDEDAIINDEPGLRRRTTSHMSLQQPCAATMSTVPVSQPYRLQRATDYIMGLLANVVHAIIDYMRAAHDEEDRRDETRNGQSPQPTAQARSTPPSVRTTAARHL